MCAGGGGLFSVEVNIKYVGSLCGCLELHVCANGLHRGSSPDPGRLLWRLLQGGGWGALQCSAVSAPGAARGEWEAGRDSACASVAHGALPHCLVSASGCCALWLDLLFLSSTFSNKRVCEPPGLCFVYSLTCVFILSFLPFLSYSLTLCVPWRWRQVSRIQSPEHGRCYVFLDDCVALPFSAKFQPLAFLGGRFSKALLVPAGCSVLGASFSAWAHKQAVFPAEGATAADSLGSHAVRTVVLALGSQVPWPWWQCSS